MSDTGPDHVPDPGRGVVVIVDVANVMGSRPDGWWRDRAGAAGRLLAELATLPGCAVTGPDGSTIRVRLVEAVVEGQARAVADPQVDGLIVHRAVRDGDTEIVDRARAHPDGDLVVVTADRGLRARLSPDRNTVGPKWLLGAIADNHL